MPTKPPTFRPRGQRDKRERERENDKARGSARERGYSAAWDKASKGHLRNHPLCRYCDLKGLLMPADRVDHLYPQRAYPGVFWNKAYWISSCQPCHDGEKQATERRGKVALDALASTLGLPALPGGGGV